MRSQEALVHLETYRALGATPVPIDVTNVLTSLQTGAVDGFDNTPLYAFATSWYQAAGHLFLSRHAYQPGIIVFSKAWYDGLSGDLQSALTSIEQSEVQEGRQAVRQMDPVLVRNLGRQRVEVHTPSDEELAPFREATSGVADAVARRAGSRAAELLRALRR
jgi:TRAP-type C4-dicarboxylate transport system substrate-binding protein